MREKISAVYKIVNEVTGDFYVGSSNDVKRRWREHKRPSEWHRQPNNQLYQNMQKYGVDKFRFQILVPVMPEYLHQVEQEYIDMLKPTYNNHNAKGLNVEKRKASNKKYLQSEKGKAWRKKHEHSDKRKAYIKKHDNQPCLYNGETLTFCALKARFQKAGIKHPSVEAKKYIVGNV